MLPGVASWFLGGVDHRGECNSQWAEGGINEIHRCMQGTHVAVQ